MISVFSKKPYTYVLYDNAIHVDYLRLGPDDWYSRSLKEVDWKYVPVNERYKLRLEEVFTRLGLECEQ